MPSAAVAIIREFITSSDPRLRRNACVGLASVGTPEALNLLIGLASDDTDTSVRQKAVRELAELDPEKVESAHELLTAKLLGSSGSTYTYAAAASLMIARDVRFNQIPITTSIRYAWGAMKIDAKGKVLRQIWQTSGLLLAGLCGSWIVIGVLCALIGAVPIKSSDMAGIWLEAIGAIALSILLGLRVIRWQFQARTGLAVFLELCIIGITNVIVGGLLTALVVWNGPDDVVSFLKLLGLAAGAIFITRAVSLALLQRTRFVKIWTILRVLASCWAGTFFLIACSFAWPSDLINSAYSPMFALTVPFLGALMAVYAYRDRTYGAPSSALDRYALWAVSAIVVLSGMAILTVMVRNNLHSFAPPPDQYVVTTSSNRPNLAKYTGTDPIVVDIEADGTTVKASMRGPYRLALAVNTGYGTSDVNNPEVEYAGHRGEHVAITAKAIGNIGLTSPSLFEKIRHLLATKVTPPPNVIMVNLEFDSAQASSDPSKKVLQPSYTLVR